MAPDNRDGLTFTVTRREPELVCPSEPTPREYKRLSDIDDQDSFRFQIPIAQFYPGPGGSSMSPRGRDHPALAIREALSNALVYYYPFAGRLKEFHGRKLVVDCTAEGVLFIQADANVTLEQFGSPLQPLFPCFEELLFDVPGSASILDCPLLLIQVTRLRCGGFILATRLNHAMSDALGLVQFLNAVGEMARGADAPTVLPVWRRELLEARNPPRVTCVHREYDEVPDTKGTSIALEDMTHRSFFFGSSEIAALRCSIPQHQQGSSTFEILTACLWRCRTITLAPDPEEDMRLICNVNCRNKFNPPLPKGFYGNALALPVAIATAGELSTNPLGYAVELIKKAKDSVTEEYIKSVADLMVSRGRRHYAVVRTYIVSDATRTGLGDINFGWGKPKYSGPVRGGVRSSFYVPSKNGKGEDGIIVPIRLPAAAMDKFDRELKVALGENQKSDPNPTHKPKSLPSSL